MGNEEDKDEDEGFCVLGFKIEVTSTGCIRAGVHGSRTLLRLFGPESELWFDETVGKVGPLIRDASTEFNKIFLKKTGATFVGGKTDPLPTAAEFLGEGEEENE